MAPRVVWDPATGQYVMANDGTGGGATTPAIGPFAPVTLPPNITPQQAAALGVGPLATATTVAPNKTRSTKPKNTAVPTTTLPPAVSPAAPTLGPTATVPNTPTTTTVPAPATPVYPVAKGGQSATSLGKVGKRGNPLINKTDDASNAGANDASVDDASGIFGGTGGTGTGASSVTATNARNYSQGANAAKYLLRSSQQAQTDYNTLGNQTYANMLAGFNPSYDAQIAKLRETLAANQKTGEKQITDAQAALMKQLQPDTTYQNAPVIQLTPEQQALGNALQTYGASDQLAKNASASQQQINQQIADMFRNTNTQLNEAQKNYYTGMQNAAAQNAAEAKTNLATGTNTALQQLLGQIEGNRATAISNAEQARQQFQTAGLTAGQQGKSDYATAMAKLIASYGAPKKTTKKKGK